MKPPGARRRLAVAPVFRYFPSRASPGPSFQRRRDRAPLGRPRRQTLRPHLLHLLPRARAPHALPHPRQRRRDPRLQPHQQPRPCPPPGRLPPRDHLDDGQGVLPTSAASAGSSMRSSPSPSSEAAATWPPPAPPSAPCEDGKILGLFPEGRIESAGELLEFQTGVSLLAIKSRRPRLPRLPRRRQRAPRHGRGHCRARSRHPRLRPPDHP